jgi:YggT family protein
VNALIFLIETFSRLYLLAFLLRILLQVARADFYNQFSQFIVHITNPLVVPARRVIPSFRRFDLPTLVVLVVLQMLVLLLIYALRGISPSIGALLWVTVFTLVNMTIVTLIICILIYAVLSWVQPGYSPARAFLAQIVDPILRPARRLLPPISGVDLAPLIVTILLWASLYLFTDLLTLFAR